MTECKVGDGVRAKAEGSGAVHGVIVGECYDGKCWEIKHQRGMSVYNKAYCKKLSRDEMSMALRALVDYERVKAGKWDGQSDI